MAGEACRIRRITAPRRAVPDCPASSRVSVVILGSRCQVRERAPCGARGCYVPELPLPAGGSMGGLPSSDGAGHTAELPGVVPSAGRTRNRAGSGVNPPRATILSAFPRVALLAADAGQAPWRRPRSSWSRSWCRRLGTRLRTHGLRPAARPFRDSPPLTRRGSLPGWKRGPPGYPGNTAVSW